MADVALYAVAAFFAGMAAVTLAVPAQALAPFGIALQQPAARVEVRAVYGGFGLAMAAILVAAASSGGDLRRGIVLTVAVAMAGMAAGRILGRAAGPVGFYPVWLWFWVEVALAAVLMAAA